MSTARHARISDTLRVGTDVVAPSVATGVIRRREPVMGIADALRLDRHGIRRMQRLRARHGTGLLRLRVPGRSLALVLSPDDVGTILADAPEPFSPASAEKRAALAHFQPHGVLITQLETLRRRGNWAQLAPRARRTQQRFAGRLAEYVDHAEAGSIAGLLADAPAGPDADPRGQVPHWLFAFDAAGIVTYRTLALLATHPEHAATAREESSAGDTASRRPRQLPFLRACVLDSVRLWPTTPLLLRETTGPTDWDGTTLPAGTTLLIYAPFFHRDERTLSYADRFAPDIWLDGTARENPALVPFSDGPAQCPGENLVLLADLLAARNFTQTGGHQLDPERPLPATVNPFSLHFAVS
ncbi:MAG: cytochrome P450 [Actinophytocola sp.]|nr:cytochrome P450 [Actinophytocola sp.]